MIRVFVIIIFCTILLYGCNRKGCTDELATNYNAKAKKDDGSCIYPPTTNTTDSEPKDTTYIITNIPATQQKVVLLEEFTGVYCYTCPLGHMVTDSLIDEYPDQLAVLNIHSTYYGIYDDPNVMGNAYDFRTADNDTIVSMLGGIISVPSGAIDRTIANGENQIITQKRYRWREYFQDRISEIPPVNIAIVTDFNDTTRNLQVVVTLTYTEAQASANYLNLVITEDKIVDKQYVDTVVVNDYEHPHILRDVLTEVRGEPINTTIEVGRVYIRVFNYTVPENWNTQNIELVSFVHAKESFWSVLQAATQKIEN
ncbi:MAG: Omp28-related outer membrane protein [Flavobacteriales bacterium]|nr:Omp28-related outer membrane protein [Flavobacteriales bacterium]